MSTRQSTIQPTIHGDLPVAHIRIEVPVLDGDPVLGFSLRGVDTEGNLLVQVSWSRGAFPTIPDLIDTLARELLDTIQSATRISD